MLKYLLFLFLISVQTTAFSSETLGHLNINEVFLKPELIVREQQEAEIVLDDSSVTIEF